jgi:hypothetical protein
VNGQSSRRDPRADPLIAAAKARCAGCRLSWRIRRNWRHDRVGLVCTAQAERQELRDIAYAAVAAALKHELGCICPKCDPDGEYT